MPDSPEQAPDLPRITAVLNRHGVDYLLVGGAAATVHGAVRPTLDVDCLVDQGEDNLSRLADAMRELNARLRVAGLDDAEAALLPVTLDGPTLARMAISTWRTDAGPLDILTEIRDRDGRRRHFHEVAGRAARSIIEGVAVRVAALDDLIASKEWADRAKDHQALPELRELRRAQIAVARERGQSPERRDPPDDEGLDAGPSVGP